MIDHNVILTFLQENFKYYTYLHRYGEINARCNDISVKRTLYKTHRNRSKKQDRTKRTQTVLEHEEINDRYTKGDKK